MPPLRNTNSGFISTKPRAEIEPQSIIRNFLLALIAVSLIISAALYGGISYLKKNNAMLTSEIESIRQSLSNAPLEDMLDLYYGIDSINKVLQSHDSVKFYLDFIADSVVDDVYYNEFVFKRKDDKTAVITVTGFGTDFASLVQQIESLKRDKYSGILNKLNIKGVAKSKDGVNFTLELEVKADIDYVNTVFVEKDYNQQVINTAPAGVSINQQNIQKELENINTN